MAHDLTIKCLTVMLVLSSGVGRVEAVVPEGAPGSPQRKGLCAEGKRDCEAKINKFCGEPVTDNTQEDFESVAVEICRAKHKKACDDRWGEKCVTSPRAFGFSHEIEEYGGTNTVESGAVRRSPPRPRPKPKQVLDGTSNTLVFDENVSARKSKEVTTHRSSASGLIAMPSLASAVSGSCEYTGPPAPSGGNVAGRVRVMTMNVFGQNDDSETLCEARLKYIGETLADQEPLFDVIGLTEVHPDYVGVSCDGEKLVKGLRKNGEYRKNKARWGHPETSFYEYDGGTSIFATSEFEWDPYRHHVERYSPEYKTRTAHGFVFARIPIVRETVRADGSVALDRRAGMIDVYVTHLYSKGDGHNACDQQCRYGQLQQLARGIHERSANGGNPVLVMGDFNIGGPNPTASQCNGNPGYGDIMEVLRNPRDIWLEAHPNKSGTTHIGKTQQRIDFMFVLTDPYFTNTTRQLVLRNPRDVRLIDWKMPGYHVPSTNFTSSGPRWIEGPFDVSDHIGIEATFEVHHSAGSGQSRWRDPGQEVANEVVKARRDNTPSSSADEEKADDGASQKRKVRDHRK